MKKAKIYMYDRFAGLLTEDENVTAEIKMYKIDSNTASKMSMLVLFCLHFTLSL